MESNFTKLRYFIDNIDALLAKLMAKRTRISQKVQGMKPSAFKFDPAREAAVLEKAPQAFRLTFASMISVARRWPPGTVWIHFAPEPGRARDEEFLVRTLFGSGLAPVVAGSAAALKKAVEAAGREKVMLATSAQLPKTAAFKCLKKIVTYRKKGARALSVYSGHGEAPAEAVVISL